MTCEPHVPRRRPRRGGARRVLAIAAAALAVATTGLSLAGPATASASDTLRAPPSLTKPPAGHQLTGDEVLAIARRVPKIADVLRHTRHPTSRVYEKGANQWQASFFRGDKEIGQVLVDDPTGAVVEAWTGYQVAWTMARGYPGAFGRSVTALYIWIPLMLLFVAPFVDVRRPLRMRHLDLLALCSLSVSLAFFDHGDIGMSVPLTYPPLLYFLGRLTWIALNRRREPDVPREPLHLLVPPSWLAVGLLFLIGFRVGLNLTDSNVIDVGYSGVIGADKLAHGHALYGHWPFDDQHGDTYGPVNYLLYLPFVKIFGWSGHWDDLPAAHAVAITFDLLCVAGMYALGRRLRGPTVGLALAYAWVAFPFTLFNLECNSNDAIVAALIIGALLLAHRPAPRGVLAALAGFTKFAPLALAPLLATHGAHRRPRRMARFAVAFAITGALVLIPVFLQHDGFGTLWNSTVDYQATRDAPFSIWGIWGLPHGLELAVQIGAALFAIAAAFLPRRQDVIGLAALGGAVLIATQLGLSYWFYLYVLWFLPSALVGVLAVDAEPLRVTAPAAAPARSRPRAAVAPSTG